MCRERACWIFLHLTRQSCGLNDIRNYEGTRCLPHLPPSIQTLPVLWKASLQGKKLPALSPDGYPEIHNAKNWDAQMAFPEGQTETHRTLNQTCAEMCLKWSTHTPICFLLIAKPSDNTSLVKASPRDERGGRYLCAAAHPSPAWPPLSALSSSSPAPSRPGQKGYGPFSTQFLLFCSALQGHAMHIFVKFLFIRFDFFSFFFFQIAAWLRLLNKNANTSKPAIKVSCCGTEVLLVL